jgi:prepilin-type N-terminal cleavage/methylation domain-containing protein
MRNKGFTLIELLIVVAIIAILAAIAVPNFLEAQVRAKVSRQLSNLRTTSVALESYQVDNNTYPLCTYQTAFNPPVSLTGPERWKVWPGFQGSAGGLTTPVAYIASADALVDIFRLPLNFTKPLANQIMYLPSAFYRRPYAPSFSSEANYAPQVNRYGLWVLRSAGPDLYYQNLMGAKNDYDDNGATWNRASYDATNGTVSGGDIYRSQKKPDEKHALL